MSIIEPISDPSEPDDNEPESNEPHGAERYDGIGRLLQVTDPAATRAYLERAGFSCTEAAGGALVLPVPPTLGSVVVFHGGGGPPWREG